MAKRGRPPKQLEVKKIAWECSKNPKQHMFLSCPADEALFGGAAGGSKSESLLIWATGQPHNGIFNNPNWKCLLLRRTFPELEKSLIWRSQQLFSDKMRYDAVKHRWTAPSGGIIQFGHIKNARDVVQYQSAEYNAIGFDELTHFSEQMYLYLFSRLRTKDPTIRSQIRGATNPGGIGHGWVKKRFIEGRQPYTIYKDTVTLPDGTTSEWSRCFIPATVFDNKYLMEADPGYVRRLMELPEVERRALMDGDWDIYSGQFFTEFSLSHTCPQFDFPVDWPVWISMDWGFQTKCAVLFFTQDPKSKVTYLFDEIYVSKKQPRDVASLIKVKLGKHFSSLMGRFTDRRVLVKDDETNVSTQEKFRNEGMYFRVADTDRVNGWHRCRELLLKDKEGNPQLKIFKNCENFLGLIPEWIHDINNPEDMDKRGECHLADAFRYFAIMRKSSDLDSEPSGMSVSPTTGYLSGSREPEGIVGFRRVLTSIKDGRNYFIDRGSNG